MRVAPAMILTAEEQATLTTWSRGRKTPTRLVQRAQIVLRAADGMENKDIAVELGCTRRTVGTWRSRFAAQRLAGIEQDAPRGGRTARVRARFEAEILRRTLQETPPNGTHWSSRALAQVIGCSDTLVFTVWRDHNLRPHLTRTFKLSNDPQFAEKVVDVVSLYLDPPDRALLVLSCDEKSQIQALDRTQKSLPLFPGRLGTMTRDYKCYGTTTLFAAISVVDGLVISQCQPRHRHQEWLRFLKKIDAETPPDLDLHLVVDNHATPKHPRVLAWLEKHPRFHMHFTTTSSSWLNLIERWFRDLTRQRLRRGNFRSVADLQQAIQDYVEQHNQDPRGFRWTRSADQILSKVARARVALNKIPTK